MERIAVLTRGLWRLRGEIAALSGMQPVWWDSFPRPEIAAVAGWGHAATAARARRLAARRNVPYVAFEDGPIRSVRPGPAEPPVSLVMDRRGIYYEARQASDLAEMIAQPGWLTPALADAAAQAAVTLRRLRLSKYNNGPERSPEALELDPRAPRRVLLIDQVRDDASIRGALATAASFEAMVAAAVADNPGAEILVKLHPDVLSGRRSGYLSELVAGSPFRLIAQQINPWSLIEPVDAVYTVSSGMGFEAALAGKAVICFGAPFYAGWGFTEDRGPQVVRPRRIEPLELFAAYYLSYARYFDPYSRRPITFQEAVARLAWLRDRFHEQTRRSVCYGITRWKRDPVRRMLDGPAGPPLHARTPDAAVRLAAAEGRQVVAWASRNNAELERACRAAGVPFVRVEDGFVRSAGLGASFVTPLSLVFDSRGIYYDPGTPSELEDTLQNGDFPPDLLARAARLRSLLVAAGTTKYNVAAGDPAPFDPGGRPVILVPGQVEDDASIRRGAPAVRTNFDLLQAARQRHPDAFIVYKPHPDVEAGFRRGRIAPDLAGRFADRIALGASILSLIALADRVETITSLAGFEALLRGKAVTTHGQPFYCGWGLTEDLCPVPRRTRRRSLDELVAAALILYPRYLDPVSGLRCPPEVLVGRLATAARHEPGAPERLARFGKVLGARALYFGRSLKPPAG